MQNTDTSAAGGKKTARFTLPDTAEEEYDSVEITLDMGDDGEAIHSSVKNTNSAAAELSEGREKKISSFGKLSTAVTASSRIMHLSRELKRMRRRQGDRSKSVTKHALVGLKFIAKTESPADAWARMEDNFDFITRFTNGSLHRSRFGQCIGMNELDKSKMIMKEDFVDEKSKDDFACELFDTLCRRMHVAKDYITKEELREICDMIADQSFDSRLQIFMDMVDKDEDGRITKDEIREIIVLSASANKLSKIQNAQVEEYARLIMEELDPDQCGYIRIENLETLLLQGQIQTDETDGHGDHDQKLSKMLSLKLKPTREHPLERCHRDFQHFMTDNWKRVWVMALWVGIMVALFTYRYMQYRNKQDVFGVMGHCVCMAKGAAETLKLNMALILLPVCRNTITWLRNKTRLGVAVPFDDNINFHQMIAVSIAIGVGIHGISHLACDFPRLLSATPEEYTPVERYFGNQPTSYWHFVKGWEGVTGILMVVLMAIPFTLASPWLRRKNLLKLPKNKSLKNPAAVFINDLLKKLTVFVNSLLKKLTGFNAFWYTHHLFVIVYALLIVHGIKLYLTHEWYKKTTWMYLAVPVALYAGERLTRAFRSSIKDVKILKADVYAADVLTLQMSKPPGFNYKSGQYIFVNCAAVSPFEWHPFSITSAPMDDYVSVHIRKNGDWTGQIIKKFKQPPPTGKSVLPVAEYSRGENNPNLPTVLIDGPYGSATQEYKDYDVVLLIGLGIGATPMISVVKDIVHNIKAKEEEENSLEECSSAGPRRSPNGKIVSPGGSGGHEIFKTRKAYFYWQTREQGSFDWFKGVMNEVVEMDDHKGIIEMHNYCTSVYEEGDARSTLITMLQSLNRAKNGVDIVSGTKVMTHFGRPKWKEVYKRIAVNHLGARVGVFYCGPAPPVRELRQLASEFSHKTSVKFEFHKENF